MICIAQFIRAELAAQAGFFPALERTDVFLDSLEQSMTADAVAVVRETRFGDDFKEYLRRVDDSDADKAIRPVRTEHTEGDVLRVQGVPDSHKGAGILGEQPRCALAADPARICMKSSHRRRTGPWRGKPRQYWIPAFAGMTEVSCSSGRSNREY